MKKISVLFSMLIALLLSVSVMAQQKAVTTLSSVKQKDKMINFNLTSTKKFIFGSNRYVLHIGNKEFLRNAQSSKNGKGMMTFYVPVEEFNMLQEEAGMYLTYGQVSKTIDKDELAKTNRCWALGKFNKTLLTK